MPSDNQTKQELQPTAASAWKGAAKEGVVIELPSGNIARVRRTMDILHLLKTGRIPNPLAGVVQKMVDKGGAMPEMEDLGTDAVQQMMRLVDDTVLKVVTEPKIVAPPEPEADETAEAYMSRIANWSPEDPEAVSLAWIDIDDRMYIFVFAQGFAADLESFRKEQAAAMASLSDVPAVPAKTKRTGGRK